MNNGECDDYARDVSRPAIGAAPLSNRIAGLGISHQCRAQAGVADAGHPRLRMGAEMSGLPKAPSTARRRPVWEAMVLGGIERMTENLMRGDEVPDADLQDMHALRQRLRAFDAALLARERAAGVVEVIE